MLMTCICAKRLYSCLVIVMLVVTVPGGWAVFVQVHNLWILLGEPLDGLTHGSMWQPPSFDFCVSAVGCDSHILPPNFHQGKKSRAMQAGRCHQQSASALSTMTILYPKPILNKWSSAHGAFFFLFLISRPHFLSNRVRVRLNRTLFFFWVTLGLYHMPSIDSFFLIRLTKRCALRLSPHHRLTQLSNVVL